ncbi:MAG: AMIN domain-containing protein [Epsilonproteobacteria bacterium]|nr:AMIN domain-containing protein [Campylobacterota bacterium]
MFLEARENPFFPTQGQKDIPYTSNDVKTIPTLKNASLKFPSSARIIKKVTVEYENLDASIETKSIKLHNLIDWHLPLFISQAPLKNQNNTKETQKRYKKIAFNRYVTFFSYKKALKILTKDKLIRNFLLARPHRIVFDFKKDTNLKSYTKKIPQNIFKKIKIGNHKGYYRVVIELDGPYRYKIKKTSRGYIITLN